VQDRKDATAKSVYEWSQPFLLVVHLVLQGQDNVSYENKFIDGVIINAKQIENRFSTQGLSLTSCSLPGWGLIAGLESR